MDQKEFIKEATEILEAAEGRLVRLIEKVKINNPLRTEHWLWNEILGIKNRLENTTSALEEEKNDPS